MRGSSLEHVLRRCCLTRPFVLENTGFQRQLIELEARCATLDRQHKRPRPADGGIGGNGHGSDDGLSRGGEGLEKDKEVLQVELIVPGMRTFSVGIAPSSSIAGVKAAMVGAVNAQLRSEQPGVRVGASWLVFHTFEADGALILEEAAVEPQVQLTRLEFTFGLDVEGDVADANPLVKWGWKSRFELVVFSLVSVDDPESHVPFIFRHKASRQCPSEACPRAAACMHSIFFHERAGAPGTLLARSIIEPYLRAWDFVSGNSHSHRHHLKQHPHAHTSNSHTHPPAQKHHGEAFRSVQPIVFSFSTNPREKRDFMNISTSEDGERQQFDAPGEGGILGMGNNAIVHHVELEAVRKNEEPSPSFAPARTISALRKLPNLSRASRLSKDELSEERWAPLRTDGERSVANELHFDGRRLVIIDGAVQVWDAAVKRPFSLPKMLASIASKAEAGVAKRLRMAGALNKQGRLLYFYGLGVALASDNSNHEQYRFEAVLLSQYQEDFSSYTLKRFIDDYSCRPELMDTKNNFSEKARVETLQAQFSLIEVKVLLVSLLNGFRDLTLSGAPINISSRIAHIHLVTHHAFDFNHLNNVLVSRDYRKARLIDIDGQSRGSIQFSEDDPYIRGGGGEGGGGEVEVANRLHKPALDIDLSTMMPLLVQQLMLGKGRGPSFVAEVLALAITLTLALTFTLNQTAH
ncbi:MAG: hypothetical protein SGPRY_008073 [Prymnesium sp.]